MELPFIWTRSILTVFILLLLPCIAPGSPAVYMYQENEGPRSIGSFVTLRSELFQNSSSIADNANVVVTLISGHNSTDQKAICSIEYRSWDNDDYQVSYENDPIFTYLNLSFSSNSDQSHMKIITWFFDDLPANYNNLTLITRAVINGFDALPSEAKLAVKSCDLPVTRETTGQNSTYNITSNSFGHYKDIGNCSCANGYEPFHPDGNQANTTAICQFDANWSGCTNFQCWKAPQVSNVSQINKTVGDSDPFECIFTQGFPKATTELFEINNTTLPPRYILKSSDNGQSLSCEVVSNYTKATNKTAKSPPAKIIVFFPPERANLSNNLIMIPLNVTKKLNFSFSANPNENGTLSTDVKFLNSDNVPKGLFNWTSDITQIGDTTQYERVLELNLALAEETQTYAVCANCSSPGGEACAELTISNKVSATFKPTDITGSTFKSTIDAGIPNQGEISIGVIIGVAVGVLAVLVIVAVVCFMRRNHGNIKEERINEIYEASPGPGPSIETVYTGTGENSRSEMTTNVAYEASPHQPEIQDVYTTVNREDKKKGRTEKDETKNGSAAATSAEENVPAVTDVYAMVKK